MTSNSGTRQLKDFGAGIGFRDPSLSQSIEAESIVKKALSKQFPPEFLNRLDDIIMFESLTADDALKIAKIEIDDISKRLEEKGLSIQLTEKAYKYIVKKGFDEKYGARSLKRAIQVHIEDNICDMILETPNLQGEILFDEVDGMIVGTANE
jgi:ATP-dependent Clp protease ATP-binding subunit ClpC